MESREALLPARIGIHVREITQGRTRQEQMWKTVSHPQSGSLLCTPDQTRQRSSARGDKYTSSFSLSNPSSCLPR